jgi:hypothetical protein
MQSTEDPAESIAKRIFICMVIGACDPIFWGIVSLMFFNARESRRTDLYWTGQKRFASLFGMFFTL